MVSTIKHTPHRGGRMALILGATLALAVQTPATAENVDTDKAEIVVSSEPVQPETISSEADTWQFEFTPYLFAAGLKGQVGVPVGGINVTSDVDMSFNDIWDNLDSGFMGLFTAQNGRWSYALDGVYFKIADEGVRSITGIIGITPVPVDGVLGVTTSISMYQGSVGYRVSQGATKVDLIGAVRYTQVKADLNVVLSIGGVTLPDGTRSAGGSEDWTDAVVGVRVLHPVSKNVSLLGYADVGAGGSDLSYQMIAGVNWEFAKDFTAKAGYRVMDWDYENDGVVWDMQAGGTYLGLGFKF